jgi:hypothetical protein
MEGVQPYFPSCEQTFDSIVGDVFKYVTYPSSIQFKVDKADSASGLFGTIVHGRRIMAPRAQHRKLAMQFNLIVVVFYMVGKKSETL